MCSNTLGAVRVAVLARLGLPEVWATHRTVPGGENANFHMGVSRQLTRLLQYHNGAVRCSDQMLRYNTRVPSQVHDKCSH